MLYAICYGLLLITFIAVLFFCVLSWRKRHITTGFYLFFWLVCGGIWVLGTLLCMPAAVPTSWKEVLDIMRMSAVVWTPVVMVCFALEYAGARRFLHRLTLPLFVALPMASQFLLLSPFAEEFFVVALRPQLTEHFVSVKFTHKPWFAVHTAYSLVLAIFSGGIFFLQIFKNRGLLKVQAMLVFTGYLFPVVGMMLSAYTPDGMPRIDYASLAFPVTAACWYLALFRYKLLEVAPIAQARIIEVMQDAVLVLTPELTLVDLNANALALLDAEHTDEVLTKHVLECWPERAPAELVDLLERGRDGRAEIDLDLEGERRIFDVRYSLIKSSRRRDPVGGILAMRDVTDHALLIEELNAYAHTVAHDLKNPLSAQRGYLEMIKEEGEDLFDEDLRHDLAKVSEITESMIAIVHELLTLASMRQHQEDIETTPIDMGALIAHVKVRQALQLSDATIVEPERWCVARGHAPWVEEVWANLMSNAVKYGGSPPHMTLGSELLPDQGVAKFFVTDCGQGMSKQQQATLFQAFSRLDEHRAIQGHGVGLSIVKRIVEVLGGEVGVESVPGEGSTFWFTLPLADSTLAPEPGAHHGGGLPNSAS